MEISRLKKLVPILWKHKITPYVWGQRGVGKTTGFEDLCDEMGYIYFNLRLAALQDQSDLLGLGDFTLDANGNKVATHFFKPNWMLEMIEYCEKNPDKGAVLILDELNRASDDLMGPIFQAVLDFKFHETVLPDNFHIIALSNPPTSEYAGVRDFSDAAFVDRFAHFYATPDNKEWFNYLKGKGLGESSVTSYLKAHPSSIRVLEPEYDLSSRIAPSDRTWTKVIQLSEDETIDENDFRDILFAMVGVKEGTKYLKWKEDNYFKLSASDVLDNYNKYRKKIQTLVSGELGEVRLSEVGDAIDLIKEEMLQTADKGCLSLTRLKNLANFLLDIPLSLSSSFYKEMLLTKEMQWLRDITHTAHSNGKECHYQGKGKWKVRCYTAANNPEIERDHEYVGITDKQSVAWEPTYRLLVDNYKSSQKGKKLGESEKNSK